MVPVVVEDAWRRRCLPAGERSGSPRFPV